MIRGPLDMDSFPDGWEDGIVVGAVKRNRNGTLSISCTIWVHRIDESWDTTRTIRLAKRRSDEP
jgi:hypothetical protein